MTLPRGSASLNKSSEEYLVYSLVPPQAPLHPRHLQHLPYGTSHLTLPALEPLCSSDLIYKERERVREREEMDGGGRERERERMVEVEKWDQREGEREMEGWRNQGHTALVQSAA